MEKNIIQPYYLTRAKYHYTQYEMRILIYIIKSFMPEYTEQINTRQALEITEDLFKNIKYTNVPIDLIDPKTKNPLRYKDALFSLNKKIFHIVNKKFEAISHLVEMPKYYNGKAKMDFYLNADLVPYFKSLADGYIIYDINILFQLDTYSQRLYMLMCQHEDTGVIKIHAKELRSMMESDDKYSQFSVFKNKIIDRAQRKLNALFDSGDSKLKFEYDKLESKQKDDDEWNRTLVFKVVSYYNNNRKKETISEFDTQKIDFIHHVLRQVYNLNKPLFNRYKSFVFNLSDQMKIQLYDRLSSLYIAYVDSKKVILNNVDLQKIISTILKKDYGYQNQSETWKPKN